MKFYYENEDFRNKPNGNGFCTISNLDWHYGFNNPIFELLDNEYIVWNFSIQGEMQSWIIDEHSHYFNEVFLKVKDKPNVRLVFSNFHEGANQNHFITKLIQLKTKHGLQPNQIVVVSNNKYAETFGKHISIIYKPYLFGFLVDHYRDIKDNDIEHNGSVIGLLTPKEYLETVKNKFFLSYNKNTTKSFRIQLILWLIKNGIIDDTYVSILIKNENFDRGHLRSTEDELYDLIAYYNKFDGMGFNILDWNYPEVKNDVFSNLKYTTKSHYADTLFNIISETSFETDSTNLTEKSFKAFANSHPFIIIGDTGSNELVRSFGFELYDDLIDYSFDSISERDKRLNEALKQIRNVYSIGKNGIIDWYKNNIDKIEYNRNKFFTYSFSKMIDETITDLKKFKKDII
jgi:hypothetical protein